MALIIETSSSYGRSLLRGIINYMRSHEEWSVFLEERALTSDLPAWLRDWRGDGLICRATARWLTDTIAGAGVPLVSLVDRSHHPGIPCVSSDQQAIGRLAAEHLLDRGYHYFGFCGFSGEAWSSGRRTGFNQRLEQEGRSAEKYESSWYGPKARSWEDEQHSLTDWIRSLKTPCGVMASNDVRAQQLLDACRLCGLAVPEEIAVIGVDNDELLCQLSNPPLSSVIPNTEQIGYLAADLLARMMDGQSVSTEEIRVPPVGIATRQSTDSVAIDDVDMASAVRFIRENACRGATVQEVLQHVRLSRSALERGFRKYLRRSPQQEIRNVQLKRCQTLLVETELPMERIAALCGFQHPEYMHVVFKRMLGMTPGQYRRAAQG